MRVFLRLLVGCGLLGVFAARAQDAGVEDPFAALNAYCYAVVACAPAGEASVESCRSEQPDLERLTEADHDDCRALLAALLERYQCLADVDCGEMANPDTTLCASASNQIVSLVLGGADVCFSGKAPVEVPDTWTCNAFYYFGGADDGCDCGCGAVDPDCGAGGGCADPGCFQEACEYCYLDGADVGCEEPEPQEGEGDGEGEEELPPPSSSCGCGVAADPFWVLAFALLCLLPARRRYPFPRSSH